MDSIVTSVIEQFKVRSKMGEQKYGVNMDRDWETLAFVRLL